MRKHILIISVGALWPQITIARDQRIRLYELTTGSMSNQENPQLSTEPSLPDEAIVEEGATASTEQVAVNRIDTNPSNPPSEETVGISAGLFDGPPGPKDCRGTALLSISLSKPGAQHAAPTCYNVPGVAQCGNFLANKEDGCQARIFSEPDCRTFANLAVFIPETRAFGGYIRSIEVRCGVVSQTPPPLDLPGLKLPPGALQAVG